MLSAPQNSPPANDLATRLEALRQRIAAAASAPGQYVDSITLLAVSKGQAVERIQEALALGLNQFGENYAYEALPKIHALRDAAPVWHFIGRLQANKTRAIAEHFDWVHSVDRLKLAERLAAQRAHTAAPLNVCVQVNVASETAKAGVAPAEALPLLQSVALLPRLQLRGLMCMLPFDATQQQQHEGFGQLRLLAEQARAAGLPLDTLSMGMSGDMEAAIAEGATMVRIGTALFGPRP